MIFRKIKILFLCFVFTITAFPMGALADVIEEAPQIAFSIENVSAKPGDYIEVPVLITKNDGAAVFNVDMTYNSKMLTPVSITKGIDCGTLTSNLQQSDFEGNVVTVYWVNPSNSSYLGTAFTVKFKVSETAAGTSPVSLKYKPGNICDQNYNDLNVDIVPGILNIGGTSTDIEFKAANKDVTVGEYVDVPIIIEKNSGVAVFKIEVSFDEQFLIPISITKNLAEGSLTSNLQQSDFKGSTITAYWVNPSNITTTGQAFTIRFKANSNNIGTSTVSLTYSLGNVCDQDYSDLSVCLTNGTVTVKPKTYTVIFNANGGKNTPPNQTKTDGVDLKLSSVKPTRTGYTFKGWNTKAAGTGTAYAAGGTYNVNAGVTLYAQWTINTYSVKYDANGGSGAPSAQTKTYGVNLTLSGTKPTRAGYAFKGWNTKADGTGTAYTAGGTYSANAGVTLYAQWTINTYSVKYDANGGNGAPSAQTKTHGVNLTLSGTKPTRAGYVFKEWNTKADGTGTSYATGGKYSADAGVTLYAQWIINTYSVKYDANGGSGAPSAQTKTYGVNLTLSGTKPTRAGYAFKGWNTKIDGTGTAYASGGTYNVDAGATLYAQWTINTYSVKYDANGGSGAPSAQTKTYGTNLTLSGTKPTRAGYTFKGWNTKADGTGTSYTAGGKYSTNAGATLYAQWTINTYSVKYDANGGSGAPSAQTKTYGVNLTLSGTKPTRAGYTFKGWNTKADGTGTSYTAGGTYNVNAGVTLYAQWTINAYSIKYDANGGSGAPSAQTKTHGTNLTLSGTKPTRSGYTFKGWNTKSDGTGTAYAAGGKYSADVGVTLYAQWKAKIIPEFDRTPQKYSIDEVPVQFIIKSEIGGFEVQYYQKGQLVVPDDVGNYDVVITRDEDDTYAQLSEVIENGLVIMAHVHTWGEWKITKTATCTEKGEEKRICSICGKTETNVVETTDHNWGEWIVAKAATCTEDGIEIRKCSVCVQLEARENKAIGHNYTTTVIRPTCTEKGYTTHTCKNCGDSYVDNYVDILGHNWGEWKTTKAATCTEDGSKERVCANCSEVENSVISKIGHNYTKVVILPTCTEKGYTTHTCNNCGDCYTDNETPPVGHSWSVWTTVQKPTASVTGNEQRICANCSSTEKRALYLVSYNSQGGGNTPESQIKTQGFDIALSSEVPIYEGYVFTGWNTASDGNGMDYAPGMVYTTDENLILYAMWRRAAYTETTVDSYGAYIICNVKIYGGSEDFKVIVATYKDGVMMNVQTRNYSKRDEVFAFNADSDTIKVMLWDVKNIEPISKVETIKDYSL